MEIFYSLIFITLFSLTIVYSFPCPPGCICKPNDIDADGDYNRLTYSIDCTKASLRNDRLIYVAEKWSCNDEEQMESDDRSDSLKDYIISIVLSNTSSLKTFTSQTIQLSNFSYSLHGLTLIDQAETLVLNAKSFNSPLFEKLKVLNLTSCCKEVSSDCEELFRPLVDLQVLDLSRSDMYQSCLRKSSAITPKLKDLILRHNHFDLNVFSRSKRIFNGVSDLSGKLDLQNSVFRTSTKSNDFCIFDSFPHITALDLSFVQFESAVNSTQDQLEQLLKCNGKDPNGAQLLRLFLRGLHLDSLPKWLTYDHFTSLLELDLSNNNLQNIDISSFDGLKSISLAYNPISLRTIRWKNDQIYRSVNLRSMSGNQTHNLTRHLMKLFEITGNIDYSENDAQTSSNLTNVSIKADVVVNELNLIISRTNLRAFQVDYDGLRRLDVSWNLLTELNLKKQIRLRYLDCSNQHLQKLSFSRDSSELIELKCSNNSLATIENFSLLKKDYLKHIDLSYNSIRLLEDLLGKLQSQRLRTINLKGNQIEVIPAHLFHHKLFSLYEINLADNRIHTIRKYAFQSTNLQILDLTGNPLKTIEAKAILTRPLRLFHIYNDTQQLNNRCAESNSHDNLLQAYINWYEHHGILMSNRGYRLDKCLRQYVNQTKAGWIIGKGKRVAGYYTLYVVLGGCLLGLLFGGMFFYRRNKLKFLSPFQRYKILSRDTLVENAIEMDQHQPEDDEIVMSLDEPPFNKGNQYPSKT